MIPSLARCAGTRAGFRPCPAARARFLTSSLRASLPIASATRARADLSAVPRLTLSSTRYASTSTSTSTSTEDTKAPHPSVLPSEIVHPQSPPLAPGAAARKTWLDRLPPWASGARPYLDLMRVDKPTGTLLLYWPCAWSITIASTVLHAPATTPLFYMTLFAAGAWVMRGAGCTINDMWDAKMDAKVALDVRVIFIFLPSNAVLSPALLVIYPADEPSPPSTTAERTKTRPIAAGTITQFQALTFLGAQLSAGLAVLTQLNWYSIVLGASSLSLVVLYPFMKRITYYPQVIFGLTFNWGAFLGWSAVAGVTDWAITAPMYVGGVAWGIAYDLIYAHQDKKDDVIAGVKSMALRFPDNSRTVVATLSTAFVSLLTLTGHLAGLGPLYYLISCGGAAAHLAWQTLTVNFDDRADCWSKFCSNGYLGGLIWLGTAANYVQQVLLAVPA